MSIGPTTNLLAALPISERLPHGLPTSLDATNVYQARTTHRLYPSSGASVVISSTQNPTTIFAAADDSKFYDWSTARLCADVSYSAAGAQPFYLDDGYHSLLGGLRVMQAGQVIHNWQPNAGPGIAAHVNQKILACAPQQWVDNQGSLSMGLYLHNSTGLFGGGIKSSAKTGMLAQTGSGFQLCYPLAALAGFFQQSRPLPQLVCGETRINFNWTLANHIGDPAGVTVTIANISILVDVITPSPALARAVLSLANSDSAGLYINIRSEQQVSQSYAAGAGQKALTFPVAADTFRAMWVASCPQAYANGDRKSTLFNLSGFQSLQMQAGGRQFLEQPIRNPIEAWGELQRSVNGVCDMHAGGTLDMYWYGAGNCFFTCLSTETVPEAGADVAGVSTKATGGSVVLTLNDAPAAPAQLFCVAEVSVPLVVRDRAVFAVPS
jgi:hypothetical protein